MFSQHINSVYTFFFHMKNGKFKLVKIENSVSLGTPPLLPHHRTSASSKLWHTLVQGGGGELESVQARTGGRGVKKVVNVGVRTFWMVPSNKNNVL